MHSAQRYGWSSQSQITFSLHEWLAQLVDISLHYFSLLHLLYINFFVYYLRISYSGEAGTVIETAVDLCPSVRAKTEKLPSNKKSR